MELIRLLLRNTLRHKLRSLLTILGIGVAVMAFVLLRTVVTAWHAGVEASTANRLITRHAVSFVFPLPLSYRDRIAQVPGVERSPTQPGFRACTSTKSNFLHDWQLIRRRFLMAIRNLSSKKTSSKSLNVRATPPLSGPILQRDTT